MARYHAPVGDVESVDFHNIVKSVYITYESHHNISVWTTKEGMMDFDPDARARDVIYLDDIKELAAKHIPSFLKTYFVAFLAIVFYANDVEGVDIFSTTFLIGAAKASLLTSLRNVYKFFTEDYPALR